MSNSRNPLVDPQLGDVIELMLGWTRRVTRRIDEWVVFESLYNGGHGESIKCSVESWKRASDLPTARVIRRGEDA